MLCIHLIRRRFDGDAILYRALHSLVLFSYIAPIYVDSIFSVPFHFVTRGSTSRQRGGSTSWRCW
jgi:hypothetical protein